ncbi:hypothetical protein [Olsenella sp. Marseille-P4559]|uniref:hypothetical protein n=1 Tax=Olsenella sp. Marseille-P4559 TaxID=2364795 RepID=UPI001031A506|nr:hypothetical protein [Olsenella sp. Marseille-P4559]
MGVGDEEHHAPEPSGASQMAHGRLADGRDVELIAVETVSGWLVIHAMTPVQRKSAMEIEATERRLR